MKKRIFSALLISALAVSALTACGGSSSAKKSGQTLTVLNYGKYIDESVVKQFEKKPVSPSNTKNMKVRKKCIPNTKPVPSTMM